jgi:hypothetical protein
MAMVPSRADGCIETTKRRPGEHTGRMANGNLRRRRIALNR